MSINAKTFTADEEITHSKLNLMAADIGNSIDDIHPQYPNYRYVYESLKAIGFTVKIYKNFSEQSEQITFSRIVNDSIVENNYLYSSGIEYAPFVTGIYKGISVPISIVGTSLSIAWTDYYNVGDLTLFAGGEIRSGVSVIQNKSVIANSYFDKTLPNSYPTTEYTEARTATLSGLSSGPAFLKLYSGVKTILAGGNLWWWWEHSMRDIAIT